MPRGSFISNNAAQMPGPWLTARWNVLARAYKTKLTRLALPPSLPEKVEFFVSRAVANKAPKAPTLAHENVPPQEMKTRKDMIRDLANDGLLAARYRVLEATNFAGFQVPSRFELITYRHFRPFLKLKTTTNASIAAIYSGTLSRFVVEPVVLNWPTSSLPVSVVDRRFRSERQEIDYIMYNATNEWILDSNDPRLQDRLRKRQAASPLLRPGILTRIKAFALWTAFGILLAIPLLWLWRSRRRVRDGANREKTSQ